MSYLFIPRNGKINHFHFPFFSCNFVVVTFDILKHQKKFRESSSKNIFRVEFLNVAILLYYTVLEFQLDCLKNDFVENACKALLLLFIPIFFISVWRAEFVSSSIVFTGTEFTSLSKLGNISNTSEWSDIGSNFFFHTVFVSFFVFVFLKS